MGSVDTTAYEPLVGLGPDAETRLPAAWVERRVRLNNALVIGLLVTVQVAWLAAWRSPRTCFYGRRENLA